MAASSDGLQPRSGDFAVKGARHRKRRNGVVFAPQDQSESSKHRKLPIEFLPWIRKAFQHAADRITVASLEMQS